MRFSVSSTALSSKLTALSRVINSKNSLPILGDFVFEISDLENNPIRIIEREPERISVSNEQEEKSVNGKTTVRSEGQVIDCFEKSITCPRNLYIKKFVGQF